MEPPAREVMSEAEVQLRDMANCLGATLQPAYTTHKGVGESRGTVRIFIPKTSSL